MVLKMILIWRVAGRESGSPELLESPRTSPEVPRTSPEVFGDFPGSSLTVELNSNPEVPRKFPRLPRKFPGLPRKFPGLPRRSAVSLGSLTPSSDSQKLSLKCRLSKIIAEIIRKYYLSVSVSVGPATTQNLVVKFDGEICGGVLVENASNDFPQQRSSKIYFQTSPEVRRQYRRKLRQLHSGNRWCLYLL